MALPDLDALDAAELERLVAHHNHRYWDLTAPEISDYDYDRLIRRLKEVAPGSPLLRAMGPAVQSDGAVRHREAMLSLDKCYLDEELDKWAATFEGDVVMMPKYDGIACALHYDARGRLVLAATRGDGVTGDDITTNALEIKDIPSKIKAGRPLEVRGEIYMRLSVFERYKADGMANPRNLAAGAIKQKDAKKSAAYQLSFAGYDLVGVDLPTQAAELEVLVAHGFAPIEAKVLPRDRMAEGYREMAAQRPSLDYEIDGVVFKANATAEQRRLGTTSHHPRFAIAYKFQGDSGTTRLLAVEWSVARTGTVTPVAIVHPVPLSGVTVERASLHHPGFIQKLGLALGAEVVVMRRGGVIPNVELVSKPGTVPIEIPASCPSCGAAVRQDKDFLRCTRPRDCRAVAIGLLSHYAATTDMLGFGETILEQTYAAGLLRSPVDYYTLRWEDLAKLERCGEKLAKKLVAEVDKRRKLDLAIFLRALGIPELGKHVSRLLVERYGTLEAVRGVKADELGEVHTIGETIACTVVDGLREASALIDELLRHVTLSESAAAATSGPQAASAAPGPFAGKSFVFTGKMATLERKDAEATVVRLGGRALDAVSKSLSFLVVGDKKAAAPSTKEKAAAKLVAAGAPLRVITETEFLAMVAEVSRAAVA